MHMADKDDSEKSPLLKSTESNRSTKLTEFAKLPEEDETKGRKWTKIFTPSVNIILTLLITATALLVFVAIFSDINHRASGEIDNGDEEFNSTNFNSTSNEIEENSELPNLLLQVPNRERNDFASDSSDTNNGEPVRKSPIVRISQGRLEGRIEKSRKGRDYYAFYSVPYGKSPTGELRFQPPQPAEKWSRRSVRDAGEVKTQCITKDKVSLEVVGTEDCLHLHIWTPKLPEGSRRRKTKPNLPVMVYIYGGGFMTGTVKRFKASYMMDEEVILVIMDYRLGAFGHLNTGDLNARGNLSLRDQILALEWVQNNIEKFGGDPNRVLLFGSSSGSISVHTILLSEMSQGLFRSAMCESGVAVAPNILSVLTLDPKKSADILAEHLGCPTNDTKEQVSCLQNTNASLIAEAVDLPGIFWGPTLEALPEDGTSSDVVLAENPMTLLQNGRFNKVPLHLGVNSAEEYGASYDLLRTPEDIQVLNENWTNLVLKQKLYLYNITAEDLMDLSSDIKSYYFNIDDENNNETLKIDKNHKDRLTDLLSDRLWFHPTRVAAQFHIQHAPVYLHYFTKEPIVSLFDSKKDGFDKPHRAGHGDQVQFLFPYKPFPEIPLGSEFTEFSQDFVKIWVSIANSSGVPDGLGIEPWEAAKPEDNGMIWFNIDDKPLRKNIQPFTERMNFWDDVPQDVLYP